MSHKFWEAPGINAELIVGGFLPDLMNIIVNAWSCAERNKGSAGLNQIEHSKNFWDSLSQKFLQIKLICKWRIATKVHHVCFTPKIHCMLGQRGYWQASTWC